MNRFSRYEKVDHISHIQASLKEMKNEVNEYLKKNNNDYAIPEIKINQYLNLTRIHNLNRNLNDSSGDNLKMIKELSSQKLNNTYVHEKCDPLRESAYEKPQKNKIVKLKRVAHHNKNASVTGQVQCLLPNICQLKLDILDKNERIDPNKNLLYGKTLQVNLNASDQGILKQKQYHSIDLNRESELQWVQSKHFNALKVTNKWLSSSKSKELINTIHKKNSFSEQEIESPPTIQPKNTKIISSQVHNLFRKSVKESQMPIIDHKLSNELRKESIIKRRPQKKLSDQMNQRKISYKNGLSIKRQEKKRYKRLFHFDSNPKDINKIFQETKNQYSPWWQNDISLPQKSLSLLQGQYF